MQPTVAIQMVRARRLEWERALRADEAIRRAREASTREDQGVTPQPFSGRPGAAVVTPRVVRAGSLVEVSGTAAVGDDGRIQHPEDPYAQARLALERVGESLREVGAEPRNVVRTRVYLKKAWQWEPVGRAHADFFGKVRPATTVIGAGGFVDPDTLVEIEATAFVDQTSA